MDNPEQARFSVRVQPSQPKALLRRSRLEAFQADILRETRTNYYPG